MDIFNFHSKTVQAYESYVKSFFYAKDERLSQFIEKQVYQEKKLWPSPLIQLNPSYESGKSIKELVEEGFLSAECEEIFQKNGKKIGLYKHQEEAILKGIKKDDYIVTSGTGSGKSLTYLIPIIDFILKNEPHNPSVRAILIYPMNALVNSQEDEIKKYLYPIIFFW